MAFICPPKECVEKRRKVLSELKELVQEMEDNSPVLCRPCCVPCLPPKCANPPDVMVCYKVPDEDSAGRRHQHSNQTKSGGRKERSKKENEGGKHVKGCKSCELRAGNLYRLCDCEKKNGLQDDCPRSECRGRPQCLTEPPTCCPSQYSGAKHLLSKMAGRGERGGTVEPQGAAEEAPAAHGRPKMEKYYCFEALVEPQRCPNPCCPAAY